MTLYEHIGFWGSIASILGLMIAFYQIYKSKQRIRAMEVRIDTSTIASGEATARAAASSDGGEQEQSQSVTQKVDVGRHAGFQHTYCPRIENSPNEVKVSFNSNGVAIHVVCVHLKDDYSCRLGDAERPDCIVLHPLAITCRRNELAAKGHTPQIGFSRTKPSKTSELYRRGRQFGADV